MLETTTVGMAGQVPAEVAGEHAAVQIVAAAGAVADIDGHGLAGEILRVGAGKRRGCTEDYERKTTDRHGFLPVGTAPSP